MGKLLGENEQLAVRNFQILRGSLRQRPARTNYFWLGPQHFDPDGNAVLQLNLPDRNGSVRAVEHAFDQAPLRVTGAISKLRHRRAK